ncbi:VOC family protein [Alkalihalobacterium elongatum]|uniref:VOC family protein n=1 Tax=Alkalihalobacterium elongatum TaxID=2675466 RepID=UPI001C201273|nr:VOC family protein [Alkalihalobacterium elongatum]
MKNAEIFETHVNSTSLERSIAFYKSLGLELAYIIEERRVAFFWIGDQSVNRQMLGVWEKSEEMFSRSHFAFHVSYEDLIKVPDFLNNKGISLTPSFGLDTSEPVVHTWMPAACYYFLDPDGNSLEYITTLNDKPHDVGVVHLSTWNELCKKNVL